MSDAPRINLTEVRPQRKAELRKIAELHMELLGFGPMAGLGELFIREAIYAPHVGDGSLDVMLVEVDGLPAGFVAYTARSISFHRDSFRRHWPRVAGALALSLLQDPRRIVKLVRALKVLRSRRGEQRRGSDPMGEVVCIAARQPYLGAAFRRRAGQRLSETLMAHAARRLRAAGLREMRMLVDADNKPVLMLYHLLGARFEPYEQAGEPMIQVWFDLDDLLGRLEKRDAPALARSGAA